MSEKNCKPCACSYEYLTLCEPIGACVKSLSIYVQQASTFFDVSIYNLSTQNEWRKVALLSDLNGYVHVEITRFVNHVEGGLYELRLRKLGSYEYACLQYDCKTTTALRFAVTQNQSFNDSFVVNAPCLPVPTVCEVVLNTTDLICELLIIECLEPICDVLTTNI